MKYYFEYLIITKYNMGVYTGSMSYYRRLKVQVHHVGNLELHTAKKNDHKSFIIDRLEMWYITNKR